MYQTKFPRVMIDNRLDRKDHITYICGNVFCGTGVLVKAHNYLNQTGLFFIKNSFDIPIFNELQPNMGLCV